MKAVAEITPQRHPCMRQDPRLPRLTSTDLKSYRSCTCARDPWLGCQLFVHSQSLGLRLRGGPLQHDNLGFGPDDPNGCEGAWEAAAGAPAGTDACQAFATPEPSVDVELRE